MKVLILNLPNENRIVRRFIPNFASVGEAFKELSHKEGDFPIAEKYSKEVLSLPIFPDLSKPKIEKVCNFIAKYYKMVS